MDTTSQKQLKTPCNMGFIRKQVGMDITSKIDAWFEDFRKRREWDETMICRGEDNKLYSVFFGISLLFDVIDEPEIPDYILISFERCLPNKKIELWHEYMTPEMMVQDLNRISGHIEGIEEVIQYNVNGNIIWLIRQDVNKKWTLRYKK